MAHYQGPSMPDPEDLFQCFVQSQRRLMQAAIQAGCSKEEARWFLLLWQLSTIGENISYVH